MVVMVRKFTPTNGQWLLFLFLDLVTGDMDHMLHEESLINKLIVQKNMQTC